MEFFVYHIKKRGRLNKKNNLSSRAFNNNSVFLRPILQTANKLNQFNNSQMKTKLLRTVSLAALLACGVFAPFKAEAQTWTGNTPQAGDFYLYNVGAGKFLTSGCWWGTHAAMDYDGMLLTFAGSGNDYTLSTNVAFANCYVGDNAYMDNGSAATWTFTQVSAGKYTMKNGSNYLVFKGGDVADTDNTAPTTDAGYWQIVSRADLINNMKSATPSSPVDASFFMENPKIRRNWKNSKPFSGTGITDNGSFNASSETLYGGGCTSVGQYRKTFDNYQVLTGLPNGKYQVTVKGQYRNEDNSYAIPYMYANDQKTSLKLKGDIGGDDATNATKSLVDDTYLTEAVTVTVTDGNLRVGVKSDANVDWCTWREFTIKFLDPALSFIAETLPTTAVTTEKWYVVAIPSDGDYTLSSSAAATITYTQDGTQLISNVTSKESQSIDANESENLELSAGSLYVKADAATTITVEVASYVFTPGQDITSIITNPGFEANGEVVNLSSSNLTGVTGWTLVTAEHTNDVGTREYSNATFASLNGEGDYCFNCYWEGKPLTQTLGNLPVGTYELSALVTTGNASSTGTVYLNAGDAHSTGFTRKSGNANFYYREKLVFTINSKQNVTIGIRGGDNVEGGAKKGAWNENGYWWYKCDDFKLKYLCEPTQANLYSQLQTLVTNCAPWTSGDEYATNYTTYASYSSSNSVAELTAAINYLTNEYERYVLENATTSHPYDLGLIKNADYANGTTGWNETHNNTGTYNQGVTSDGSQTNFYQVATNTYLRHATIYQEGIVLDEGIYRLSAKMKGSPKDDESTYIYATTGAVDHWGGTLFAGDTYYGYLTADVASSWSTINAYITLDAPARVRIGVLSWGNNWNGGNGGAFSVDDWKLEKIDYAVTTKSGVTTAFGPAPVSAINYALTSDVAAVNLQKATGLSSAAISTTNNPNLLIFANSGQVSNTNNVVVDGICSTLVLVDGHPFVSPTVFTATNAQYTLSALAGGNFATLMIPFAASTLPGSAYTLDQGVDLIDGNIRGTSVSSIAANSPVLVTASGNYTGSNVTVPVVAAGATYTNGELIGTYTPMTAVEGSYVLQNHTNGEGVAFYLVGSTKPTVNPFRAYIKPQASGVKAFKVLFGDADGIGATRMNNEELIMNNSEIFNLAGQRLTKPVKGINIVNGKKVIVK